MEPTTLDLRVDPKATPGESSSPRVRSFAKSDVGLVRTSNQDHFLIAELARMLWVHQASLAQPEKQYSHRRGHMFLLADGMGGHRGGEIASALTMATVESFLLNVFRKVEDFESALKQAHSRILQEAVRHPEVAGMGTTLTLAIANKWNLYVAHAGDSRCYLLRGDNLQQITTDHTVVAELVRRGIVKPEDAAHHAYRHVITNAVGGRHETVDVELKTMDLEPQDTLLLCTDGLTDMLTNDQIKEIVKTAADPEAACMHLVQAALTKGGRDNVTVIVARFENDTEEVGKTTPTS